MQTLLKRIILVLAVIGFVVGLYGLYLRFTEGHRIAAYGSYVPWGLWIAGYVTLVGTSAGAVAVSAVVYALGRKDLYPLATVSMLVAFAAFVGGMFLVWVDLGHAERFWKLFLSTSFTSVMGWMVWFYTIYGFLLLVGLWFTRQGRVPPIMERFAWLVLFFAVAFAAAEGMLFGVVGAQPLWESAFTPILFLVEGAAFGLGAVLIGAYLSGVLSLDLARRLGGILMVLLASIVALEFAEMVIGLYSATPAKMQVWWTILSGPYWWVFWILHLGLGIILPMVLLLVGRVNVLLTGIAGLLVTVMGLTSKLNLIVPSLAIPELKGLLEAFTGPGLTVDYFPTVGEWLVFIWATSLAVLVFLLGTQLFPALSKTSKEVMK